MPRILILIAMTIMVFFIIRWFINFYFNMPLPATPSNEETFPEITGDAYGYPKSRGIYVYYSYYKAIEMNYTSDVVNIKRYIDYNKIELDPGLLDKEKFKQFDKS